MLFASAGDAEGPLDEESGEGVAIDFGEDHEHVGEPAVGDPHLLAGDPEAAVRLSSGACPGAERVRSRAGFGQGIAADAGAADEIGEVARPLIVGAKHDERQDAQVRLRTIGCAERGRSRDVLGDDQRRDAVEVDAAIGHRHVHAEQSELAAPLDQQSRRGPVLLLQSIERGQHFLLGELGHRFGDEPMLLGPSFGRERGGWRRLEQPRASERCRSHRGHAMRSKTPAAPMPPPTHIVTRP